jgi:membrane protein DedA with SNARE-associated domain
MVIERVEALADLPFIIIFFALVLSTYVSEDLTCATAGLMIARGHFDYIPAAAACLTGIFTGDLLLVLLGRFLNRKMIRRFPMNRIIRMQRIQAAEAWFEKRGPIAVFISRFIPGTRFPTYLTAGLLRMPLRQFTLYFLSASIIWPPFLVGISYKLGEQVLPLMETYAHIAPMILLATLLTIFFIIKLLVPLITHTGRRMLLGQWRRMTQWEFWPPWIFSLPMFPIWLRLALKHRSLTVFTAANPMLDDGGFINESKAEILGLMDSTAPEFLPFSLFKAEESLEEKQKRLEEFMSKEDLDFPLVLKPDRGQRGAGVKICQGMSDTASHFDLCAVDLIAQAYAPGKEYGVFYSRHPDDQEGRIISVTVKEMLTVTGNGHSDLSDLILDDPRAVCMHATHFDRWASQLYDVPESGEVFQLTELGTHCKGALFRNGQNLITSEMTHRIEEISQGIQGFNFGRYDIRCQSEEDFKHGKNWKIVELNGVTSEATHIYEPGFPLFAAYRVLSRQWAQAFAIGAAHASAGVPLLGIKELWQRIIHYHSPEA